MAGPDTGFSDKMCCVLRELRPDLIKKLNVNVELLAHLMASNVFQTDEYILAERTRSGQARKLLDDLQRRPGADFWKFVMSLYETHQGHIAELILRKYEERGGVIPLNIRQQRQDHVQGQAQQSQPQVHRPQQQQQQNHQQQHRQQPQREAGLIEVDDTGDHRRTLFGNVLSQPENEAGGGSGGQQAVRPFHRHHGSEQIDSRQARLQVDADDVITLTAYYQARQSDPDNTFRMESMPRGLLLVIDNEIFRDRNIPNRDGTRQDCDRLVDLFHNRLGFKVEVQRDRTGQEMLDDLRKFTRDLAQQQVDSCAVAILSHGCQGDTIFGCDGRINERGNPTRGTYITTSDLRNIFSAHNCPAMKRKPKLFIVQACRGDLQDTATGVHHIGMDILPENPTDTPHHGPSAADVYFLYATVEDFAAYRGKFIQCLARVFQEHADSKHIKNMATTLHHEMSNMVVGQRIFTIGEERGNLTKDWFFNPPSVCIM